MKRVICFLLAALLCVSLVACAMSDGYGKYANIYRLLDAGDYAGAHAAIDALAGITTPTTPATQGPTEGTSTEATTVPPETTAPAESTVPTTIAPVDPENATYVLNTSSMKFHKPSCGSVSTIKRTIDIILLE